MKRNNDVPIIIFDGVCNLCNAAVRFILKYDKQSVFRFTSLQSEKAREILEKYDYKLKPDSILLIEQGKIYQESTAVLRISKRLSIFRFIYILIIIPGFIRDPLYRVVAKKRYRWFGKRVSCIVPAGDIASRFL